MKNIYVHLSQLQEEHNSRSLALATILQTKGSTPQVPGASSLFSPDGLVAGTLGGGLLEGNAQKSALKALKKGASSFLRFSLNQDISTPDGAICGGEVTILVDADPQRHAKVFHNLAQSLENRRQGVLATIIEIRKDHISISRKWAEDKGNIKDELEEGLVPFHAEIQKSLIEHKPFLLCKTAQSAPRKSEESFLFLDPQFPLSQLVVAGAGHIGQAVSHLGSLLNFEVTVIDDRPDFACTERLPDADHIIVNEIGKSVGDFSINPDTYVVIVTRGHRHDAEALRSCISKDAAYIGMIGSRRKIALMRKKFIEERWAAPGEFDRVHAPIGVDIDSKTVEEIAVSIAAQLVQVRRARQKEREG